MFITKKKGQKFDQDLYDKLFLSIEYNLRELGMGDVSVNKKMKELNKILYDILLKFNLNKKDSVKINFQLISKYFGELNNSKSDEYLFFEEYLVNFYNFCFELPIENMLKEIKNFKY